MVSKTAVRSRKVIVVDRSWALSGNCFQGSERGMEMILNVGNKARGKGSMNYVIKPESEAKQTLTRWVGRGSSWQVDDLDLWIRSDISVKEFKVKV